MARVSAQSWRLVEAGITAFSSVDQMLGWARYAAMWLASLAPMVPLR